MKFNGLGFSIFQRNGQIFVKTIKQTNKQMTL